MKGKTRVSGFVPSVQFTCNKPLISLFTFPSGKSQPNAGQILVFQLRILRSLFITYFFPLVGVRRVDHARKRKPVQDV